MLNDIIFSIEAVLPLVLIILTGYVLRRSGIIKEEYFKASDKLVYTIFLPCSIFCSMYNMDSGRDISAEFVIFIFVGTIIIFALGLLSSRLIVKEKECQSVAAMTVFRANSAFIGLPLATALCGNAGAAAVAATMCIGVPVFNILTFFCYPAKEKNSGKARIIGVIKDFFTNPMMIACLLGIAVILIRKLIPTDSSGELAFTFERDLEPLYKLVNSLGGVASTIALLNIGGLINFKLGKGVSMRNLIFGCVWKNVLAPALMLGAAILLVRHHVISLTAGMFAGILAHFGTPASVSGPTMAAELGGDANLARCYTVTTTVLSAFTLPLFTLLLCTVGII